MAEDEVVITYEIVKALVHVLNIDRLGILELRHALRYETMHVLNVCVQRFDIGRIIVTNLHAGRFPFVNRVAVNADIEIGEYRKGI
jgi:hypothetical protein